MRSQGQYACRYHEKYCTTGAQSWTSTAFTNPRIFSDYLQYMEASNVGTPFAGVSWANMLEVEDLARCLGITMSFLLERFDLGGLYFERFLKLLVARVYETFPSVSREIWLPEDMSFAFAWGLPEDVMFINKFVSALSTSVLRSRLLELTDRFVHYALATTEVTPTAAPLAIAKLEGRVCYYSSALPKALSLLKVCQHLVDKHPSLFGDLNNHRLWTSTSIENSWTPTHMYKAVFSAADKYVMPQSTLLTPEQHQCRKMMVPMLWARCFSHERLAPGSRVVTPTLLGILKQPTDQWGWACTFPTALECIVHTLLFSETPYMKWGALIELNHIITYEPQTHTDAKIQEKLDEEERLATAFRSWFLSAPNLTEVFAALFAAPLPSAKLNERWMEEAINCFNEWDARFPRVGVMDQLLRECTGFRPIVSRGKKSSKNPQWIRRHLRSFDPALLKVWRRQAKKNKSAAAAFSQETTHRDPPEATAAPSEKEPRQNEVKRRRKSKTSSSEPHASPPAKHSTPTLEDVFSALDCPVCFEPYDDQDHVPVTFPCGHSTCLRHVPMLGRRCPTCRAVTPKATNCRPAISLRRAAVMISQLLAATQSSEMKTALEDHEDDDGLVMRALSTAFLGDDEEVEQPGGSGAPRHGDAPARGSAATFVRALRGFAHTNPPTAADKRPADNGADEADLSREDSSLIFVAACTAICQRCQQVSKCRAIIGGERSLCCACFDARAALGKKRRARSQEHADPVGSSSSSSSDSSDSDSEMLVFRHGRLQKSRRAVSFKSRQSAYCAECQVSPAPEDLTSGRRKKKERPAEQQVGFVPAPPTKPKLSPESETSTTSGTSSESASSSDSTTSTSNTSDYTSGSDSSTTSG